MAVELGVLVADARWNRLAANVPAGWWQTSLEQQRRHGIRLVYLSAGGTSLELDSAVALWATESGPQQGKVSTLPRLCYNLLVAPSAAEAMLLRSLNGRPDTVVFNETNRWDEAMLHGMLRSSAALAPYLPEPLPAGAWNQQGGCLVEPLRGPARTARRYRLPNEPTGPGRLAAEWRLYLHRNGAGAWVIAGSVAKHDRLRSPRLRERCWPFDAALDLTFGDAAGCLSVQLHDLGLAAAETVSRYQPGLVHCAVDFWVDRVRRPCLADLTGRFRTDWLAKAGQRAALRELEEHPLRFAAMLAQTGGEKLHVDFGRPRFGLRA